MDIQFYGANCFRITTKKASVLIDDAPELLGGKTKIKPEDIVLVTGSEKPAGEGKVTISFPGEYEASGVSIIGVAARAHVDESGLNAVMYRLLVDDIRVGVIGNVAADLSGAQLEALGAVDVLIIPVGGHGLSLEAEEVLKLVKKIEPKVIIPSHYAEKGVTYPVPQSSLDEVVKVLAIEPEPAVAKFKLKASELTDTARLVILEKQ